MANVFILAYIPLLTLLKPIKLKDMWYNRFVFDDENNVVVEEKYYVENPTSTQDTWGVDSLGLWVEEFWTKE